MLDLQPLLATLSKVSDGRILEVRADAAEEGDICRVSIPVAGVNPADRTDQTLRRYAKDWIRKQGDFNVEVRFLPVRNQSWFADDGKETPLYGLLLLTWWPQPALSEDEKWEREKWRRLKAREAER